MKILQVMAGAEHGGAETACIDMCIAMHEAGEIINVVTRSNAARVSRLKEAGIFVHTLPFGGKMDIFTPLRLKKIIKEFQPHIVQTWMSRSAQKMPKWKASSGIPRYLVVSRLGGYYKIKYFKASDYFATITPDIRDYLIKNGVSADHIRHINNFAETEEVVEPLSRSDYGIPKDAPLLLGLGRLHVSKAFDTLIKVVAGLPGVYLWIAGEGPDRILLENLIKDLGVEERVKLLGWRSDRAALFQASDICVFSSRYEPFGTVFVQAWAQKTPLVTSDADGPRQFVRHEEDGLLVPVDNQEAFAAAIMRMIEDKDLRDSLVKRGYERYEGEFTKKKSVQNYLQYFHDILDRENL